MCGVCCGIGEGKVVKIFRLLILKTIIKTMWMSIILKSRNRKKGVFSLDPEEAREYHHIDDAWREARQAEAARK